MTDPLSGELGYLALMEKVWTEGDHKPDRTGVGTRSLFGEQLKFDLRLGFPLLTTKFMPRKSIITELLWFLKGRQDVQWLQDRGCTIWDEWATEEQCERFGRNEGDLGPVYGPQWRNFGERHILADEGYASVSTDGFDQIAALVKSLRQDPYSRRQIVTAWNPHDAANVTLPPCHTLFQCNVRPTGVVDLHLFMRSADLFLGVPFNIASYAFLLSMLGRRCSLVPGVLTVSFSDVHLYNNHDKAVHTQLQRTPTMPPSLFLVPGPEKELWDYEVDDFAVMHYTPQEKISAPVAV